MRSFRIEHHPFHFMRWSEARSAIVWRRRERQQSGFAITRMYLIELENEVVIIAAQLHHRDDRGQILSELWMSNVLGQPTKERMF